MSLWEDSWTSVLPGFWELHSESVTYAYANGTADATIDVISEELIGAFDDKEYGWVGVKKSDITLPREGDVMTIGGAPWTVCEVRDQRDGTWQVRVYAPKLRP